MNPEIVSFQYATGMSSPGECGWLRACGKARGHHFEHLQLTGSVQSTGITLLVMFFFKKNHICSKHVGLLVCTHCI